MSTNNVNSSYIQNFFIIPFHITKLPNITFGYIKVYEAIFQFWNSGKKCFLSLQSLCERSDLGKSQVCEALVYFEKHNELIRKTINKRRYFIRPELKVEEYEDIENELSGAADSPVRQSGLNLSGGADTNNNQLIKEINTTTTSSVNFNNYKEQEKKTAEKANESHSKEELKNKFKEESLNDEKCNEIYNERFLGFDVSIEDLYKECVDYWSQQNQLVFKSRFLTHLKKSPLDKYRKIDARPSSFNSQTETQEERIKRYALEKEKNKQKMGITY